MDDMLERLARFEKPTFPRFEPEYRQRIARAQIDARAWSALRAAA
ncbi:MAG: hypothetical protein WBA53_09775 [Burkholderiaceae bacterium]